MEYDEDLLTSSVERRELLSALVKGGRHRKELESELGVSRSTCHRIIRSFEDRGVIKRDDDGYGLTELGHVLEREVTKYEATVQTICKLGPLLESFAAADVDFPIELFLDAEITEAQPEDPYPPINRFVELLDEKETFRNLDMNTVSQMYYDEVRRACLEKDKHFESIYPKSVVEKLLSEYPDDLREGARRNQIGFKVLDDLSFGMSLYEDHLGLRAYESTTGSLQLFAETDNPEAVAWGEEVFDQYRNKAEPLSEFEDFPDWAYQLSLEI